MNKETLRWIWNLTSMEFKKTVVAIVLFFVVMVPTFQIVGYINYSITIVDPRIEDMKWTRRMIWRQKYEELPERVRKNYNTLWNHSWIEDHLKEEEKEVKNAGY